MIWWVIILHRVFFMAHAAREGGREGRREGGKEGGKDEGRTSKIQDLHVQENESSPSLTDPPSLPPSPRPSLQASSLSPTPMWGRTWPLRICGQMRMPSSSPWARLSLVTSGSPIERSVLPSLPPSLPPSLRSSMCHEVVTVEDNDSPYHPSLPPSLPPTGKRHPLRHGVLD